jgi:hypothetical protein
MIYLLKVIIIEVLTKIKKTQQYRAEIREKDFLRVLLIIMNLLIHLPIDRFILKRLQLEYTLPLYNNLNNNQ